MRRILIGALSAVCTLGLIGARDAEAKPKKLKGEYGFTASLACLYAPGSGPSTPGVPALDAGFTADLRPVNPSAAFTGDGAVEGIAVLNADGTGTATAAAIFLTRGGVSSNTSETTFTFTVDSDDTIEVQPTSRKIAFIKGPRAGQTATFAPAPLVGLASKGARVLTLATVDPQIETMTFSNGDAWPRICSYSYVLTETK